jgi:hypothetical protein
MFRVVDIWPTETVIENDIKSDFFKQVSSIPSIHQLLSHSSGSTITIDKFRNK